MGRKPFFILVIFYVKRQLKMLKLAVLFNKDVFLKFGRVGANDIRPKI